MVYGYVVIQKKNGSAGPQYPVKKSLRIGRGTHCDIRIHVQSVSEQHSLILVEKGKKAQIQNLSATSFTAVNGVSVGKGTHELNHGDLISVGEKLFQWHYAAHTPFFEGKIVPVQKRRKSEADSASGSQNVAVVNPLYHKRRTIHPTVLLSDTRSPKVLLKPVTPADLRKSAAKAVSDHSSPALSKSPASKTPKTPRLKTPASRASAAKSPLTSPRAKTPLKSPAVKTPLKSRMSKTPLKSRMSKTPLRGPAKTPSKSPAAKTPVKCPAAKTPLKSPAAKTPLKSPAAKTPLKSPAAKTPLKSPAAKTPLKSPVAKTPLKSPVAKTSAGKSRASKTPAAKKSTPAQTGSKRKSKSVVKSVPKTKGQKRRLSSPAPVAAKRFKIESPKSIDKKKMAVLMGIHGKSRSSTLSTVKVVLSAKKTPVIKAIKTPRSSTIKKGSSVMSSVKKARRPLFSDILKKKAVKKANAIVKKLTLVPRPAPKSKKVEQNVFSLEIPQKFKFGSTGHANSPETIFISRKVAKTPVVMNKGRKDPLIIAQHRENINLSGVHEILESAETVAQSPAKSPNRAHSRLSEAINAQAGTTSPLQTPTIEAMKMYGRSSSRSTPHAKLSGSLRSSVHLPEEKLTSKTPRSTSISQSHSKKPLVMLTSTPAAFGKRQSYAESAFESPSSLLTGQISAPQSPASGRKSRLDMVVPKISYVHSPHASPVKSSLKSSPSKSPPSGGHGKSLSVSFDDSISIKTLVAGSRKSLNTIAPLYFPASPRSEGHSGVATPDLTTFDFNSIKTPNVPREMFVSSILSSGTSNSSQASGSAKRKGKTHDVTNLHGVRRLMKTPSSPTGYVDVKGVKRLMTAACKTPTYLAVEGVKKLFGDAAAAAGNELSSFAGVRELFASPSPSKTKAQRRVSSKESSKTTPRKSPVAKIQAEVETKGRSTVSTPKAARKSLPSNSPVKTKSEAPSSEDSAARVSTSSRTSASKGGITRKKSSENLPPKLKSESSPSRTPEVVPEERVVPKRGRPPRRQAQPAESSNVSDAVLSSPKVDTPVKNARGRPKKGSKVSTPATLVPKSPSMESPPKRKTRKAAKVSNPLQKSPEQELPKTRTRRGAAKAPTKEEKTVSPAKSPSKSPIKATSKMTVTKTTTKVSKSPSPVKSPPTKRTTRRAAKPASSPKTKGAKRILSPSKESLDSPAKKTKTDTPVKPTPKKSVTKRTKKEASPKPQNKRKAVTFDDEVVTPKKRATSKKADSASSSDHAEPSAVVSPLTNKKAKRETASKKAQKAAKEKEASPNKRTKAAKKTSPVLNVSPRRTRSRK